MAPSWSMRKRQLVGGRGLGAGGPREGALLQHEGSRRGVGHHVGDRAAERPRLGQRAGDVRGEAGIEPLPCRLGDPDVATGHRVDVLHPPAQAVGLVDQGRTLRRAAVGAPRVEVVVAALVVDGAVAADRRAQRGEQQVRCSGRRRLNSIDAHGVPLCDGDQHVAPGGRHGEQVVVGGVGRVDRREVPLPALVPAGPVEGEHVAVGGHVEVGAVGGQCGHAGRDVLGDFGRPVAVDHPGHRGRGVGRVLRGDEHRTVRALRRRHRPGRERQRNRCTRGERARGGDGGQGRGGGRRGGGRRGIGGRRVARSLRPCAGRRRARTARRQEHREGSRGAGQLQAPDSSPAHRAQYGVRRARLPFGSW